MAMLLSFELKVTTINNLSGHWRGENLRYIQVRSVDKDKVIKILDGEIIKVYHHKCDDGWEFDILVREISSVQNDRLKQYFKNGFCNFDYMIDNIINYQSCETSK